MTARIALAARTRLAPRTLALVAALSALLALASTAIVRVVGDAGSGPRVTTHGTRALTAQARASISAALGAAQPSYRFAPVRGQLRASNPYQHMELAADGSGVLLSSHGLRLRMGLSAVSYGAGWLPTPRAPARAHANRLSYASARASSWYVNGPLGVEQGFTVPAPRGQASPSKLALAIALSGNTRARLASDARSIRFSAGARTLSYAGLSSTDARGRALPSRMTLTGGRLVLRVDTRGARFPVRVDPTVESEVSEQKLTRTGSQGERAGLSVALSADGDTAVVGAPNGSTAGGAVWVFKRSGTAFGGGEELMAPRPEPASAKCLEGEEVTNEGNQCGFGRSVAVSGNGETVLVGAPAERGEVEGEVDEEVGAAWAFTHTEAGWQEAELTSPKPASGGHFGRGVALSENGETALVGAPGENDVRGRAWVFSGAGASWHARPEPLTGGGEGGPARFGESVALSGDGATALVSGPANEGFRGAVWVFHDGASSWEEQTKLTGREAIPGGHFGYSVALSSDARTALVGAPANAATAVASSVGDAWVFTRSEGAWSEQAELAGAGEKNEQFGFGVALAADGDGAVIGAPLARAMRGAALVYERVGTSWTQVKELRAGATKKEADEGRARFGKSVSMSADEQTLLVGGPAENNGGESHNEGAAWVFGSGPAVTGVSPKHGEQEGGTTVTITGQHLEEASAVDFGASAAASFEVSTPTTIAAVSPPGTGTVHVTVQTPLGVSEATEADEFAYVPPTEHTGGHEKPKGEEEHETPPTGVGATNGSTGAPHGSVQVLALEPTASGACGVTLASARIAVQVRTALVKLRRSGTGGCRGHVTLSVKVKVPSRSGRAKSKLTAIGTANFKAGTTATLTLKVKLNRAGRALLKAAHWRLGARLLVFKSVPAPVLARTSVVRLTRQAKPKPRHKS